MTVNIYLPGDLVITLLSVGGQSNAVSMFMSVCVSMCLSTRIS